MASNPTPSTPTTEPYPTEADPTLQIRFKRQGKKLLLLLPPERKGVGTTAWADIWEQFKLRLSAVEQFWQSKTTVHLMTEDRLLDVRQLQEIANTLSGLELKIERVHTTRRQTAVAAATAGLSVEQRSPTASLPLNRPSTDSAESSEAPLYLQSTIRSGTEIRHAGSVIVLGDVNPGGSILADGDILVWGRLKGIAHAGFRGNTSRRIMAIRMEPTQLRIADKVARPPETPPSEYLPEVAYVGDGGIRIALAHDFSRWLTETQA